MHLETIWEIIGGIGKLSDKKTKSCQDFKVTAISGMKKPLHRAVVKKNKQQKGSRKWW